MPSMYKMSLYFPSTCTVGALAVQTVCAYSDFWAAQREAQRACLDTH